MAWSIPGVGYMTVFVPQSAAEKQHSMSKQNKPITTASPFLLREHDLFGEAEVLRVTLSSIGDGVVTTDCKGKVATLNPVAEDLTGWTQEQALGVPLEEVFHIINQQTRAEVENPALRALRDGVIVGLANHTLLIKRDGTERNIDDSAAPIKNEEGEVAGAVLVFRDISERHQSDLALRESEIRYRRLFQTVKDGVLILNAVTGKITDANAFIGGLLGMDAHELLGKELHEIGLLGDVEASKLAFKELQHNKYIRYEHLPLRSNRGDIVEVEVIANVYEEDHSLLAQCNIRDISVRVAMEKKIQRQTAALVEEARRKGEFLATLSHELRNPLAPIRAAIHLLQSQDRGEGDTIMRQAHDVIQRQVTNLAKIISDLMEISRVVGGRIKLQPQTVDLNHIVEHALETTTPLFQARKQEVILKLSSGKVWASVDPARMEEVLVNILTNSAKYTPDGGKVEVWCELSPGTNHAQVRIRDNGVGIDPDMLREGRIFDLFTRADRSLNRSDGGLGIGLSLAHRLVELHGGTIEAFSPPEMRLGEKVVHGSEFIVQVPMVLAPQDEALWETSKSSPPTLTPKLPGPPQCQRVLVVDDNVDLVTMLCGTLRHHGFSVQSAHSGPDGLSMAQEWQPDVVLLDIGLPGLDGYEVARRLRHDLKTGSTAKRMRLIAVTGYGSQGDIALAREAGFDGHLVKPVDFKDLVKMMKVSVE